MIEIVYGLSSMVQGETLKRLICLSLVLFLFSGCVQQNTIPTAVKPDAPIDQSLFATSTEAPLTPANPLVPSSSLHRGVNLGNMLDAPKEGDWGLSVQENYFDRIKEAGFDFVRLPVRWSTHAQASAPYTIA